MRRSVKFVLALLVGLAALTWVASLVMRRAMRSWSKTDADLRASLAVSGARQALVQSWQAPGALQGVLSDIARNERVMGALACSTDRTTLAKTRDFPEPLSCRDLEEDGRALAVTALMKKTRSLATELPGGGIHISTVPVEDQSGTLGVVVVAQDLSYVKRREATTHRFLLWAFGILAAGLSGLTLLANRQSLRSWSRSLRQHLRGGAARPELKPLLADVRRLADRIVTEREAELTAGAWNPARLKQTLWGQLQGERVVVMANREPYVHQRTPSGEIVVQHPASGLVTALEPVMRACSGVWVAHGSGSADRDTVDAADRVRVPPGEESYLIRRVWLSEAEERGYYLGFANEGMWPLCHLAHARPIFRAEDFAEYQRVNQKFVDAVCQEVDSDSPVILVQDYHFALAPRMLREKLPRATVITFWHIPWPSSERLGICPWATALVDGLLGSSILGFQTQSHCNNFIEGVDRYLEARIDRELTAVVRHGDRTLVRPYPISVEWPNRWLSGLPKPEDCRREVFAELGLPGDALLGVGVDRLDYTKGIEERLLAVELLLDRFPEYRGKFVFAQLAAPSRTDIERYRLLDGAIQELATRINQRFGAGDYRPVILLKSHHEPPRVFRFYRAADVCYVSSLHDGMNLVAKEFVVAREDEQGVLVLSQFTGAAREMPGALIVNPYDLEQASSALRAALTMPASERRDRMRSMRGLVAELNVYRWAGKMLVDAARLRRRERLKIEFGMDGDG